MMLTANKGDKKAQMAMFGALLVHCGRGSLVKFAYHAGHKASDRAKREAAPSIDAGIPAELLCGRLHSVGTNKRGQCFLRIEAVNRVPETGVVAFRTINPLVGELTGVEVLEIRFDE